MQTIPNNTQIVTLPGVFSRQVDGYVKGYSEKTGMYLCQIYGVGQEWLQAHRIEVK